MISCYKLGPVFTKFILSALILQYHFTVRATFSVLIISFLFKIVIIFAFLFSYCNAMPIIVTGGGNRRRYNYLMSI